MVTLRALLVIGVFQLSAVCFGEQLPALDSPLGLPRVAKSVDAISYVGVVGVGADGATVQIQPRKDRFTYAGREYLVANECNPFGGSRCLCRAYLYRLESRTGLWRCVADRRLSGHAESSILDGCRRVIVVIGADRRGRRGQSLAVFLLAAEGRGRFHKYR